MADKPHGGYTANHTSCLEPGRHDLFYQQTLRMGQGGLWMSDTELLPSQSSQIWGQNQTNKQTDALKCGECPDTAVPGTMGPEEGPLHLTAVFQHFCLVCPEPFTPAGLAAQHCERGSEWTGGLLSCSRVLFFLDSLWTKDPQFKFPILTAQYLPSNTNTRWAHLRWGSRK